MLLAAGFHGVGNEGFHFFATADNRDPGVMDHADQVATYAADVELGFHVYHPP
jgi:hypothetical protein